MRKHNHPSTTAIDARAKRRHDATTQVLQQILASNLRQEEAMRVISSRMDRIELEYDRIRDMGDRHAGWLDRVRKEVALLLNSVWLIDYKAEEAVMRQAAVGSPVLYKGEKWWMACPERDSQGKVLITRVADGLIGEVDSYTAAFLKVADGRSQRSWRSLFGKKRRKFIAQRVDPKDIEARVK